MNVPFWDQWHPGIAGLFIKAQRGGLALSDFTTPHNEHPILVPRILYLLLGSAGGWNTLVEMWAEWLIVCATSLGVLALIRRTQPPSVDRWIDGGAAFLWFLCNLLIFSPTHAENWLWGIGLANMLSAAWLVAALVALRRPSWPRVLSAAACCAGASFSTGNGILCWPIAGAVLAWSSSRAELKQKLPMLGFWVAAFAANAAAFASAYLALVRPTEADRPYLAGLGPMLRYGAAFPAGSLVHGTKTPEETTALALGLALLALLAAATVRFVYLWRKEPAGELWPRMLPWLALAAFTLVSGLAAARFRGIYGVKQAIASRYGAYSIWVLVALVSLVPMVCADLRQRLSARPGAASRGWLLKLLPAFLAAPLIVLLFMGTAYGLETCSALQSRLRAGKAALLLSRVLPDNPFLGTLAQDVGLLLEQSRALYALGYLDPPPVATGFADEIEDRSVAPPTGRPFGEIQRDPPGRPGHLTLSGWAVLRHKHEPAHAILLTRADERGRPSIFFMAKVGLRRDDVAQAEGSSAYRDCGWMASFPAAWLPAGGEALEIGAWAFDTDTARAYRLAGTVRVER